MENNKRKGLFLHIVIPILLGALIYYIFSPEVFFVKKIDAIINLDFHIYISVSNNLLFKFIRNYFLDMLWAYALFMALFYLIGNNTASLLKIFIIAFSLSATMEILQITPIAKGTFDLCDIGVEFLAEVIAVLIIKNYFLKEKRK